MKFCESPDPASIESILEWEQFFRTKMPADLKALLEKSDGPILWEHSIQKELQILSAKDAVEFYAAYEFDKHCKDAIPVSMDGCGNFVVYKRNDSCTEKLYAMSADNLEWSDAVYLKDNLTEVIHMKQRIEEVLYAS